ncbi:MAG: hypothetical protein KA015_03620 [Spirochaetes bacterium]|nr:hypothetical protein [Spirochaetota bacterium]
MSEKEEKTNLADQVDIALYYVGNDMVKAKQMAAGSYKDAVAMKGVFSSSSLYGVFLIFFNKTYNRIMDSLFVISPDYTINSLNNHQDWRTFEKDMLTARQKSENARASSDIKDKIERSFTGSLCVEIGRLLERKDEVQAQHIIQKILTESTGFKRVELKLLFQETSSLDIELDSQTSRKMDAKAIAQQENKSAEKTDQETPLDEPQIGKDGVKLIIKGALNLSPIKGKHISSIVQGDKVMITLLEENNQTIQIAQAFRAYDVERKKIMPLPARITTVKFIDGVGYKIFALIAKGVYTAVIEEETNIKVALDPIYAAALGEKSEKSDSKSIGLPAIISLVAVLLALVAVIVFIVL